MLETTNREHPIQRRQFATCSDISLVLQTITMRQMRPMMIGMMRIMQKISEKVHDLADENVLVLNGISQRNIL